MPRPIPECGTNSGYKRHKALLEPACDDCLIAHADHLGDPATRRSWGQARNGCRLLPASPDREGRTLRRVSGGTRGSPARRPGRTSPLPLRYRSPYTALALLPVPQEARQGNQERTTATSGRVDPQGRHPSTGLRTESRGRMMTAPHYIDESVTLYHGECIRHLTADGLGYDYRLGYGEPVWPDNSVDAVVTDPPYGISFMGREWDQPDQYGSTRRGGSDRPFSAGPVGVDHNLTTERSASMHAGKYDLSRSAMQAFQAWCEEWARECLRILKPGGHLVSFGGSRTWHRLSCGVEDAGFEIRDSIAWLYGSGFPKSMDVSKAIDKAAGAEREVIGTEPDRWTGKGGVLNFSTDRPQTEVPVTGGPATEAAQQWQGWGTALKPAFEPIVVGRKPFPGTVAANVLEHGPGALNIDGCRVEASDSQLAEKYASVQNAGPRRNDVYGTDNRDRAGASPHSAGRWPTNVVLDESQAAELDKQTGVSRSRVGKPRGAASGDGWGMTATGAEYDDQGGASRFFPVFRYEAKAPTSERPRVGEVAHPTVKPLDFMRWLVRLVTPPGGIVLEPFAGSGTTAEACVIEGFKCIAIEREADYLPLIVARLSKPIALDMLGGGVA